MGTSKMPLAAGTRLGRYEILSPLGRGGMGEVYRARDTRLQRDVAIKILPGDPGPEQLARFEREARAASALNHPNVLTVHDVGRAGGRPYVVCELLEGETLRARLDRGPLALAEALGLARQIAEGLIATHDKGIVHRDLKPENLFLTPSGTVKILDFGLAKTIAPAAGSMETAPGLVMGTPGYMAPEQLQGKPADPRSDLFALGAILHEMVTARRAFQRASSLETASAVLTEEPPDPPAPPAVVALIRRCLCKRPDERFATVREVAHALDAIRAAPDLPTLGVPAAMEQPPARPAIAVLPFRDLAGDTGDAHLGLGLADATITELAALENLLVRPTSTIVAYRGFAGDSAQAARELGVDAVLDGSFQRAGTRLRVTVQLVAADGRSLWGAKVDTTLDDLFTMQDEVSRKISQALAVRVTAADERRRAAGRAVAANGEAYELYLRGRARLMCETEDDYRAAAGWFEEAVAADAGFAPAWAGLADAWSRLAYDFEPEGDWHGKAWQACRSALRIDPQLPEARYVRARLVWSPQGRFDHQGALRDIVSALRDRPSLDEARVRLAVILYHVGLLDAAERELRRALALSPDHLLAHAHVSGCAFHRGDYAAARDGCLRILDRMPSYWPHYLLAHSHLRLGDLDAARRAIERMERDVGAQLTAPIRAVAAAREGREDEARREAEATARERKAFGHYHHAEYDVATVHALLGDARESVRWLRAAAADGYPCAPIFEIDPLLAGARSEADYGDVVRSARAEGEACARTFTEAAGA